MNSSGSTVAVGHGASRTPGLTGPSGAPSEKSAPDRALTGSPVTNDSMGSRRMDRRELLQIFAVWTFMATLTAANSMMEPRGRGLQPLLPAAPVALAFIQCYLWALVTPLIFWMASRFSLERGNWLPRLAIFSAAGVVIANFVSVAIDFMRFEVLYAPRMPGRFGGGGRGGGGGFGGPPGRGPFEPNALFGITHFWWLDDLIVFGAVLAVGFARDYFLRYQQRRAEATLLQTQAAQLQAQLVEARLSALRSQLNPHFLFNTLNAVSALVERDPRGVRRMIARLSELLRYSLSDGNESEVALSRELAFLDRYLEIMQIRFQGRLEISRDVHPEVAEALVPNLVLQTLVENALKYGVDQQDGTGRIEISAARDGDLLTLRVRDHGPGLRADDRESSSGDDSGFGLRNTRARLQQLYGDDQRLELRGAPDGGVIAEVILPFHTMADLRTTGEMLRP